MCPEDLYFILVSCYETAFCYTLKSLNMKETYRSQVRTFLWIFSDICNEIVCTGRPHLSDVRVIFHFFIN